MSNTSHKDTIEFAGDYNLTNVVLHNHEGEGLTPDKKGHDINDIDSRILANQFEKVLEKTRTSK